MVPVASCVKVDVYKRQAPDNRIVEMMEIKDHPWYIAVQFHPEFKSRPNRPHPLFKGFVGACLLYTSRCV